MAIRLEDVYLNTEKADERYPHGSFKNSTAPSNVDGTPLEKKWANDVYGLLQHLLRLADITPSGAPDNALASDYFNALEKCFLRFPVYNDTGSAGAYELTPASGAPLSNYFDGLVVKFKPAVSNTGASSLSICKLGSKPLTAENGANLKAGAIVAGQYAFAIYRASADRFEMIDFARKSDLDHTHDSRYYTQSEISNLLSKKSATNHTHDSRYYTESEISNLLSKKSATNHTHDS
ncbi:MAG: hypothetical protein GY874_02640, partial [Desulfobacteraceae bacterium]|nr:hypothetical protein [Desulfobacteraceae bacterium]